MNVYMNVLLGVQDSSISIDCLKTMFPQNPHFVDILSYDKFPYWNCNSWVSPYVQTNSNIMVLVVYIIYIIIYPSNYPPTTIKGWLHGSIPSHYCWLNTQTKLCFSCTPINTRSVGSDGHVHQAPQNLSGCGDLNRFKHQKLWFLLLNIGI